MARGGGALRILQVVPTYLPAFRHGGPIRSVHGLARSLVARGHEVVVYTTDLHGDARLEVPLDAPVDRDGVAVRYFRARAPRRLAYAPELKRALGGGIRGFDLVHLQSIFLWPTLAAARAAERAGVPWVVSPRGMLVEELFERRGSLRKRLWLALCERRTLERARRIVATSRLEAEEATRFGLRLPAIEILPNGIDPAAEPAGGEALPDPWRRFAEGGACFLFLGRLSWKKGIDGLLKALAMVPGARLVVAGNDDEGIRPALEGLARQLGISDRVLFAGFVDGPQKEAGIAASRALVLPSTSENFGNVVLEAWRRGVPAIVTPGVGLADAVAEAGAGMVVEADALGAALSRLENDAAEAQAMGERGRALVAERYAWPKVAEQAEALYARVLAEAEGAA